MARRGFRVQISCVYRLDPDIVAETARTVNYS